MLSCCVNFLLILSKQILSGTSVAWKMTCGALMLIWILAKVHPVSVTATGIGFPPHTVSSEWAAKAKMLQGIGWIMAVLFNFLSSI